MKTQAIQQAFGLDHLSPLERPEPTPGPVTKVIMVGSVSLNYRDLLTVTGLYNPKQPLPLIPCSDGAGVVEAVGPGVTRVKAGDRVATIFAQKFLSGRPDIAKIRSTLGGPLDGTLTERMLLHEDGVVPVPAHLSLEEAATLPCAAVTAWNALVTEGNVRAGDTVLCLGTGGVSIFALQFARALGARVIITSSSNEKLARARELGASDGINYREKPDWGKAARKLTDGVGVDHVVEVGGTGTLQQSLTAIAPGGQISFIGRLGGEPQGLNLVPILMNRVRIQGIFVGHRESFEQMNRAVALHRLRPVIDKVFPFAETRQAFAYMKSGEHFGKIVIKV